MKALQRPYASPRSARLLAGRFRAAAAMRSAAFCVLALLDVGLSSGCIFKLLPPPDPPKHLIEVGLPTHYVPDEVVGAHDQLVADEYGTQVEGADLPGRVGGLYIDWERLLKQSVAGSVQARPITYLSRDAAGNPIRLTGMLYLPPHGLLHFVPKPVSLIAYPHGTELKRDRVPSRNAGDEWVLGAAAALVGGYAVAMPDLPGMGGADPPAYHPYCHGPSLAYAVADMIQAVIEAFDRDLRFDYAWDDRLYIVGYSAGGYAAMATVRELQLNADRYPGLRVTGAACMGAPLDLSGAMRKLMVDRELQYTRAYFLPYVILGYHAVFPGEVFDPDECFNPVLLPDILSWMDGSRTGTEVDTLLADRLGVDKEHINPRSLLNSDWVARQLDDEVYETSDAGRILRANDVWSGWTPNGPMLLLHSPDDECVPIANSQTAFDAFVAAGAGDHVSFHRIGRPGDGFTHVKAALIAVPAAITWFRDGCPPG